MKPVSACVFFALLVIAAATPARSNLVARWAFDDGLASPVAADDIGGFDGSVVGDAIINNVGYIGGAIDIGDDNGFVNVGDHLAFTGTDAFSIQLWISTTQSTSATLLTRHSMGVVNGYGIGLNNPNNGGPEEPVGSFYVYQSDVPQLNSGAASLNDGLWHHVVAVRDNSHLNELRLYVDGERAPLSTSTGALNLLVPTTAPLLIGGVTTGGSPTGGYNGYIDEVRVWDHALSDDDVKFFYNQPESLNSVLCGDFNYDEQISASDAQGTLRVAVGTIDGLDCISDVNSSSSIIASDALSILRKAVGQVVALECPICIAGELRAFRVETPCTNDASPICTSGNLFFRSATVLGETGTRYDLTLRIRGVVEQKTYVGGAQDGMFVVGGVPASDGYNVAKLEVSDPPGTFYLNAGTSGIQRVWELDVTKTIPVNAGATLTLSVNAQDNFEIANTDGTGQPVIPDGIPPAPEAYDGQFLQLDALAIEPAE